MKDYPIKSIKFSDEAAKLISQINKFLPIGKTITTSKLLELIVIEPNESPLSQPSSKWVDEVDWYDIIDLDSSYCADNSVELFDKLRIEFEYFINSYMKNHQYHSYESFKIIDGSGIVITGFKKETPTEIDRRIKLSKLQSEIQRLIVPEINRFIKSKNNELLKVEYEKELAKLKKKYNQ